jgi:hypothetical protein
MFKTGYPIIFLVGTGSKLPENPWSDSQPTVSHPKRWGKKYKHERFGKRLKRSKR